MSQVPGPKRGEIVRQVGEALRQKLDLLGKLVRLLSQVEPPLASIKGGGAIMIPIIVPIINSLSISLSFVVKFRSG